MIPTVYLTIFMLGAAAILLIGFLGRALMRKTSIPHIVWLMLFGLFLGPVLGIIPQSLLYDFVPFVASVVLVIVLFNAGLILRIKNVVNDVSHSALLAIVNFFLATVVVSLLAYFAFGFPPAISVLTGLSVGSVSSVLIPLFGKDPVTDKNRALVHLESIITEPLGIVLVLVLISAVLLNNYNLAFLSTSLVSEFSIGIVIGAIFGMVWVPAMSYLQRHEYEYSYAASLALVFMLYIFVQDVGGSGPISALIFGAIIANGEDIYQGLKYKHSRSFTLSSESKSFNDLITFITTSFFFVYFGGLVNIKDYFGIAIGLAIALVLMVSRYVGTWITLDRSAYTQKDKAVVSAMLSRGTGNAIVCLLAVGFGIVTGQFIDIIFSVIIFTILINAILSFRLNKSAPSVPVSQERKRRVDVSNGPLVGIVAAVVIAVILVLVLSISQRPIIGSNIISTGGSNQTSNPPPPQPSITLDSNGCTLSGLSVRISNALGGAVTLQRAWALSGSGFQIGAAFPVASNDFNMSILQNGTSALLSFDNALYCTSTGAAYSAEIVLQYSKSGSVINTSSTTIAG